MIATPCYGGMMYEQYVRGLTNLVGVSTSIGMNINMATITNESLVQRARNELVKYLLMTDCTHLFFIDADTQFNAEDVFNLLLCDKDYVVGVCPKKYIRWDRVDLTNNPSLDDIKRMTADYVISIKPDPINPSIPHVVDNLAEIHNGGSGFMCIKRSVIETMIDAYPETRYVQSKQNIRHMSDDGVRWALFDTMIDDNGSYLSEDYTFCRRWQKIGGQIWFDPKVVLGHVGSYKFTGHNLRAHV